MVIIIVIVLFSNVILLSLINAILGDVYEEVITVIDEKCLRSQTLETLRNEALWPDLGRDGSDYFAWVDYVS
jgi:hypothetical protein